MGVCMCVYVRGPRQPFYASRQITSSNRLTTRGTPPPMLGSTPTHHAPGGVLPLDSPIGPQAEIPLMVGLRMTHTGHMAFSECSPHEGPSTHAPTPSVGGIRTTIQSKSQAPEVDTHFTYIPTYIHTPTRTYIHTYTGSEPTHPYQLLLDGLPEGLRLAAEPAPEVQQPQGDRLGRRQGWAALRWIV